MQLQNDLEPVSTQRLNGAYLRALPLVFIGALILYKAQGSLAVLRKTFASGLISSRPEVVAFGANVSTVDVLQRSINYFAVIWPALAFGILISAAVRAFVSPQWIARMFAGRTVTSQLKASLSGAPLMLCSCCVTPIFTTVAEASKRLSPALTVMLASPSLNPAALTLTFLLFQPTLAVARVALALFAVLCTGPVIEKLFPATVVTSTPPAWVDGDATQNAFLKFSRSLFTVILRTVPALAVGVICSMIIVQTLPTNFFAAPGAKILAVVAVATVAVPLALPTFLEIPLALSLLAAGLPPGAAVALLFAGPAINLPSLLSIARVTSWKMAGSVALMIWLLAIVGGLLTS